ncbi:transcription elongation factor GreB, partial [Vibrio parahaemolyticus]
MILSHNIKNLDNVTESMALEEMLSSDVIVTKRGHLRDSITYLGLNNFTDKFILDIDDNIEENINSRLNDVNSAKISIDISLMERKSLAELFSIIAKLALNNNITIVIIYSLAKYSPP